MKMDRLGQPPSVISEADFSGILEQSCSAGLGGNRLHGETSYHMYHSGLDVQINRRTNPGGRVKQII